MQRRARTSAITPGLRLRARHWTRAACLSLPPTLVSKRAVSLRAPDSWLRRTVGPITGPSPVLCLSRGLESICVCGTGVLLWVTCECVSWGWCLCHLPEPYLPSSHANFRGLCMLWVVSFTCSCVSSRELSAGHPQPPQDRCYCHR